MRRTLRDTPVLIVGAGLAVGAVWAGMTLLGTAHADTGSYVHDVNAIGVTADTDSTLLNVGQGICRQLTRGYTAETIARQIYVNSAVGQGDNGVSITQARAQVALAVIDLCPFTLGM